MESNQFFPNNQDFVEKDYVNDDQRIIGGKRARKGQFPYQVSIPSHKAISNYINQSI